MESQGEPIWEIWRLPPPLLIILSLGDVDAAENQLFYEKSIIIIIFNFRMRFYAISRSLFLGCVFMPFHAVFLDVFLCDFTLFF